MQPKDVIGEEATARACWEAPLAMTRTVALRPSRALERRQAKVMVRPRFSQSCEVCQRSGSVDYSPNIAQGNLMMQSDAKLNLTSRGKPG